jgi:uncharacterized membrane protein
MMAGAWWPLALVLVLVLVLAAVLAAMAWSRRSRPVPAVSAVPAEALEADPAVALLRERYARGEIDTAEFEERQGFLRY